MKIDISVQCRHPYRLEPGDVERLFRFTLSKFGETLSGVEIAVHAAPGQPGDWPRCQLEARLRGGEALRVVGSDPDAYACVRSTLRRAERAIRRRTAPSRAERIRPALAQAAAGVY